MKLTSDRPRRHRIIAAAYRVIGLLLLNLVLFGEGPGALTQWLTMIALLFLALGHDLVAAILESRAKVRWKTVRDGLRSVTEGHSE